MKKRALIILFVMLGCITNAQHIKTLPQLYADKNLILNVKQYGQFIKRFNYEEDFSGNPISKEFKKKINRGNYILYLFNNKDARLNDSIYLKHIEEFIGLVVSDSLKINRLSDSTFAFAKCQVTYNKVPQKLYLILHTEKINKGYRWAIYDANASFIPIESKQQKSTPALPEKLKLIPPTSNEVNFIHLKKIFQEKENLSLYASNKWTGNGLNSLIDVLKNNELEFDHVENLKYYIFDIKGWVVEVSEFIRNTENSGWLISNITKYNESAHYYITNLVESKKNNE